MTLVSVVIAAYNSETLIDRAIKSVFDQHGTDVEVLVVDDQSTDGTKEFVRRYGCREARVRLIECDENGGPGFARNLGVAHAKGEWIAVLDADDAFVPNRLQRLVSLAQEYDADVISDNLLMRYSGAETTAETMFPQSRWNEPTWIYLEEFIRGNFGRRDRERRALGMMKPVIKRSLLLERGISYEISRFAEDFIFDLRIFLSNAKWLIAPFAGYEYTVRTDSLTMTSNAKDIEELIRAEKNILSLPAVQQNAAIKAVLYCHLRSLERGYVWTCFSNAVKALNFREAARICMSNPEAAAYVTRECARHIGPFGRKLLSARER